MPSPSSVARASPDRWLVRMEPLAWAGHFSVTAFFNLENDDFAGGKTETLGTWFRVQVRAGVRAAI